MSGYRSAPLRYRVTRGISLCLVVFGVVGLISTVPDVGDTVRHPMAVQALIIAVVGVVVGAALFLWSRVKIKPYLH